MEEQQIILQPEMAVIGGGAVTSVNGYTGDVVLTTSDLENTSDYQTGSEVEGAISIEATAREAADNNLQTQIDAISASSDVTDIVGTYAELQNYDTSKLGDNDIIKVLQDENQNDETTYYRWSTTTQSFTLIGEEGPYYTKAQADVLLNAKQDTLTAGTNIQISNNTISATDTTYSNFTGTDGTAAGTAGLVPAPATTDAGKFLKADGTWDDAGGGVTELTSADYDYPTDNPTSVALWKKPAGMYYWDSGVSVRPNTSETFTNGMSAVVFESAGTSLYYVDIIVFYGGGAKNTIQWYKTRYSDGVVVNIGNYPYANILNTANVQSASGASTADVMSQNATTSMVFADPNTQRSVRIGNSKDTKAYSVNIGYSSGSGSGSGYVSGTYSVGVGSQASIDTGSNYSVAIGSNSQIGMYLDGAVALGAYSGSNITAAGMMDIGSSNTSYGYNSSNYRLLTGLYDPQSAHDAATKGYVDTAVAGGGDAFTELTSSDYNYPADNPDGVAVWLLPLGLYKFADGVKVYHTSTASFTASTDNPHYLGVLMDDVGDITGQKLIVRFALHISGAHSRDTMQIYKVSSNGTSSDYQNATSYVLRGSDIYNGLNQTSGGYALDARQGKVLNDKITALEARVAALEGN